MNSFDALQRLVMHHKVAEDTLLKHSFGLEFVKSIILNEAKTVELSDTLKPLETCLLKKKFWGFIYCIESPSLILFFCETEIHVDGNLDSS